jgi:hypothetical protein
MKRGNNMKAKNIVIKNITTNTLLVGTQLEWNMWLQVDYVLDSPSMVMQALRKQYPEYEFEFYDVADVVPVRALFNSNIK